jgi:PelA/Pel-15E family pectate lyase
MVRHICISFVTLFALSASLNAGTPAENLFKKSDSWFESARIDGFRYKKSSSQRNLRADPSARPLWARFYEIESNRPFFCDRDGVPKYDIEEIGNEHRGGYTWYGNWGDSVAKAYAKWPDR